MAIEPIENVAQDFEDGINLAHTQKQSIAKTLLNNAGIIVGVFIMFAVVVVVTTDFRVASWEDLKEIVVDFALLLLCSYSMYVNCSDSGMRLGLKNKDYLEGISAFNAKKEIIIKSKNQRRLHEFCRFFIERELENTKMNILAVVGYDYDTYMKEYAIRTKKEIDKDEILTKAQRKAINRANAVAPIVLTPEMIMKRGRHTGKRGPLGMAPETKKYIAFGMKLVTTTITTALVAAIIIEFVVEPTWLMFAECMLRLLIVILNGFSGYKLGYENIVFDTVNYMGDQTDLMEQAIQFFEDNPEPEQKKEGIAKEGTQSLIGNEKM